MGISVEVTVGVVVAAEELLSLTFPTCDEEQEVNRAASIADTAEAAIILSAAITSCRKVRTSSHKALSVRLQTRNLFLQRLF